jgi:hypothetical protein
MMTLTLAWNLVLFKWCTMTIDLDCVLICDDMIEGSTKVEKSNNKKNP